jgi:hypothetical protein
MIQREEQKTRMRHAAAMELLRFLLRFLLRRLRWWQSVAYVHQ